MSQPPPGYVPPPNVTIVQKRSGCGPALIVILILFIVGSVVAVLFMGGCLAVMS